MTQNFDANFTNVTEVRTNEHTNGRTERRKLYTRRHKCRGYKQIESPEIVRSERLLEHDVKQDRIRSDGIVDEKLKVVKIESTSANTAVSNETRVVQDGSGNLEKGGKGNQSDDSGFVQKPFLAQSRDQRMRAHLMTGE